MGDWDGLADDIALAWWLSDRDKDRDKATQEEAARAEEQAARAQQWAFRRELALHGAALAAQRWEAYAAEFPRTKGSPVRDEDAVRCLATLGFTRRAAVAALNASGWRGDTTEERTVEAILTPPPGWSR